MILSLPIRRAPLAALAAIIVAWSGPHPALAQAPSAVSHLSSSGSFLAAQHASRERDPGAAATFYRAALRNDPQMRAAFIDRVAAPIANKMFECGLLP